MDAGVASGAGSTAAEALRVIRAAKLHRHGPPTPAPAPVTRWALQWQSSLSGCFPSASVLHFTSAASSHSSHTFVASLQTVLWWIVLHHSKGDAKTKHHEWV